MFIINIASQEIRGMEAFRDYFSQKPFVIAGPCSAESPEQLHKTIQGITEAGINVIRAGIWKPRSRPDSFEGAGEKGLEWLRDAKKEFNIKIAVEVANPSHVALALKYNVDIIWIGARTSVNPFAVQEVAEALKGVDIPVLIKNPINPDLPLWIGAIERVMKAGIKDVGAIHRGFSSFQPGKYRNTPVWQIPIELRRQFPDVPLFGDPSHIAGDRRMVFEVSQTAMDFNYDGLIIEVHHDPDHALSDAKQQITPERLVKLLTDLKIRSTSTDDKLFINQLAGLREQIDGVDRELVELIARRMNLIDEIGKYKKENNIAIFQLERWEDIIKSRPEWGKKIGISAQLVEEIFKSIHSESLKRQTKIFNADD